MCLVFGQVCRGAGLYCQGSGPVIFLRVHRQARDEGFDSFSGYASAASVSAGTGSSISWFSGSFF